MRKNFPESAENAELQGGRNRPGAPASRRRVPKMRGLETRRRDAGAPGGVPFSSSLLCAFAFLLLPVWLCAATNDLTSALQRGLFEEEANHNLEAAAQAYQAVSARFDQDRKLAATAIFRLGEVYRKQGKTNQATSQYERIVREFSDQSTLATLSRQNLAGIGRDAPASVSATERNENSGPMAALQNEMFSLAAEIERLKSMNSGELRIAVQQNYPNPVLTELMKQMSTAEQNLAGLQRDFSPNHPDVLKVAAQVETIHKQINEQVAGAVKGLEFKVETAKAALAQLGKAAPPAATPPGLGDTAQTTTDEEEKEIRRIQVLIQNSPDLINAGQNPPIFPAVEAGYLRVVRFLLDQGADVNAQPTGTTPLHSAAKRGQKAMTELLLSRGANVNARITVGNDSSLARTPLHEAAQEGFQAVVEVLLANKADVAARDANGNTPLHLAARRNRAGVVAAIAPKMPDINAENEYGITALGFAAAQGNLDSIKALLAAKAGVMAGLRDTPLLAAINYRKSTEIVEVLLREGADPNAAGKFTPMGHAMGGSSTSAIDTPLHLAAERGQPETVKLLIQFKADPNVLDAQNRTPLSRAGVNTNVVKLLLEAKADPNLGTAESPLLQAVRAENAMLAEMLLRAGADPNQETGCYLLNPFDPMPTPSVPFPGSPPPSTGATKRTFTRSGQWGKRTPLQAAALEDHTAMVKLLLQFKGDPKAKSPHGGYPLVANTLRDAEMLRAFLEAGADANASDWNRRPILLAAAESGNVEAVKLLLAHGAEVNARDAESHTPLHLAVVHGRKEAAEALLAAGADPNLRNKNDQTPLDFAKQTAGGPTVDIKALGNELAALLRKHGALDDLPKLDRIEVRRPSANYSAIAFPISTNGWNEFSLLELMALHYGFISTERNAVWEVNQSTVPGTFWRKAVCQFPDLSRVVIRRPAAAGAQRTEMTANVAELLDAGDCARDVKLQAGDIVEIPEADHPVNEPWVGLAGPQLSNLLHCVSRTITLSIKGVPTPVHLSPEWKPRFSESERRLTKGSFMLKSVLAQSRLLRASSDVSRVKVTRRAETGGKIQEWVLDCGSGSDPDLWLRDGDMIEVPDKP